MRGPLAPRQHFFRHSADGQKQNLKTLGYRNPLPPDLPQLSTSWNNGGGAQSSAPAFRYDYTAFPQTAGVDSSSGAPAGASSPGPAATEFIATPAVNLLPEMEPPPSAAPMPGPSMRFQFGGGGSGNAMAPHGYHSADQPDSGGITIPWAGMSQPETPLSSTPTPASTTAALPQPSVATTTTSAAATSTAPANAPANPAPSAPPAPAISFTPAGAVGTFNATGPNLGYQATLAATGATLTLAKGVVLDMNLVGANPNATAVQQDPLSAAPGPSQSLVYQSAWNGIDVSWGQVGGALKDSFIVHPGADPNQIVTAVSGATSLYVDPNSGVLDILLPDGLTVPEAAPVVYTVASDGAQTPVSGHYLLEGGTTVGFFIALRIL